jgi:hypothetical protein
MTGEASQNQEESLMATVTIRNGIDVDQLLATVAAIKEQPSVSTFTFKAEGSWENGTLNRARIGEFVHDGERVERPQPFDLVGDEPPVLLGSNAGPNAVELLLAALGFCYAVGYAANAAARVAADFPVVPASVARAIFSTAGGHAWIMSRLVSFPEHFPRTPFLHSCFQRGVLCYYRAQDNERPERETAWNLKR